MKKTLFNRTIPVLLVVLFCTTILNSQSVNTNLKEGDPVPQWLIEEQATYDEVKQKFIEHYGEDKEGWPVFIQESERLFEQFQEFNSKQKHPHYSKYSKFFNNELKLGHNQTKSSSYIESHVNSYRNYTIVNEYITILYARGSNSWTMIGHEGSPKTKSYLNADSTDGILPLILYTYISYYRYGNQNSSICPIGMLDWYFDDVFPVIDLLYQQDDLAEILKILESVQTHIKKLINNYNFKKADIWGKSVYAYISSYRFQDLRPEISEKYYQRQNWFNYQANEDKYSLVLEQFQTVFNNKLHERLDGISFKLTYPSSKWTPKTQFAGELIFEDGKQSVYINKEFSEEYSEQTYEGFYHTLKGTSSIKFSIKQGQTELPYYEIFNDAEVYVVYDESIIVIGEKDSVQATGKKDNDNGGYGKILTKQKYLFTLSEKSTSSLSFVLQMPLLDICYFPLAEIEASAVVLIGERNRSRIQQQAIYAFEDAVDEVLNNVTIVPQIYGMKYDKKRRTRIAIEASTNPREVKTDGESTVEITVSLFEYTPNTDLPSTPVEGKKITFSINEQYGITPGTINTTTVVTDIYGEAKIIYTAPTGEALQQTNELINTATVNVACEEYNVEELAYIGFASDKGVVKVDPPIRGIVSNEGIVPPDSRFPASITVNLEDDRLKPMPNTKVDVKIVGNKPLGILKSDDGQEGVSLSLVSDPMGDLEIQYLYNAIKPPDKPVTEIIEIKTADMAMPLRAYINIGLNLVFDVVENAYEGKGIVNTGEKIPLRIRVKDTWYPKVNLEPILKYWGSGNKAGDIRLDVNLEIEKISTVPKYFLEQVKLENYPEEPFIHNMNVRSFKDKKVYNMLWLPSYSLEDYKGYPRISPTTIGNHYYEAHITLVDSEGKEVFPSKHPARKALFNLQTGLPAEEMHIFFINNPFNTESKDAKLLATALDVMGFGAILSVTDALYKINNGDTEGLYNALFSEVKGVIFEKVGEQSAYNQLAVDLYSGMALAEKVGFEIVHDKTGTLTQIEGSIFKSLYETFQWDKGQIVILVGDGNQILMEEVELSPNEEQLNKVKSIFNMNEPIPGSGTNNKPDKLLAAMESNKNVIPASENKYISDKKRNTTSIKSGSITVYIIPSNMKVKAKNHIEIKRF